MKHLLTRKLHGTAEKRPYCTFNISSTLRQRRVSLIYQRSSAGDLVSNTTSS